MRLGLWVGLGVVALAALILAIVLAVPHLVDLPRVQALAAAHAGQALGRPVRFASASVRLLPAPRVELRGLEVAEDPLFGAEPFVTLERASLSLRLGPLVARRLEFGELRLERPLIRLVEGADGQLNVASLGAMKGVAVPAPLTAPGREHLVKSAASGTSLQATRIVVEKGTVSFTSRARGPAEYRIVDLDLRLRGDGSDLTVAGQGTLTPGHVTVSLVDIVIGLGGARSLAEASVGGEVRFESDDVGPLVSTLVGPDLRVTGRMRGALRLGGDLASARASGPVQFSRAQIHSRNSRCLPPERALAIDDLTTTVHWADRTLAVRPLEARMAGGLVTANVTVSVDRGVRAVLSEIAARGLAAERILVEFLCDGYAVTGPLDLSGSLILQAPDLLQMSGEGRVNIGRGRVVGPVALRLFRDVARTTTLAASAIGDGLASPFEFESITGGYRSATAW